MSTPELGPAPVRTTPGAALVHRLVTEQFPQWSALPVRPVAQGGWDNATFHLGDQMLVRMPTAAEYALAVDKEHRWLPALAPRLPRPVPTPLAQGEPGAGYPYPWSVYAWLPGEPARSDHVSTPDRLGGDLAEFVLALQGVETAGGPRPGPHNWYRGGPLRTFAPLLQRALDALGDRVDAELAREIWAVALRARWDGVDVWFHGDLAPGNLLLADGELSAVIDFGTCGVGDPACDLAIAWTLLTAQGRQTYRSRLGVDPGTWARGRGWALWKTLTTCASTLGDDVDEVAVDAWRVLEEIGAEYAGADDLESR